MLARDVRPGWVPLRPECIVKGVVLAAVVADFLCLRAGYLTAADVVSLVGSVFA